MSNKPTPEELAKQAAQGSTLASPAQAPKDEVEEAQPEKVLIDKITLENIMERLAAVENSSGSGALQNMVRLKGNRTAKVRFVDDEMQKLVIGYGKSWDKTELGGRKFLVVEVLTIDRKTGAKEKHEKEAVLFVEQGVSVEGEIINIDRQETEKQLGFVNETKVDYDNYRSYETDKQVPLTVTSVKHTYTIRLPNKEEVVVPEEGLN